MKKILSITLIALMISTTLSAQSRVDKTHLTFESKSEKLTKATGWKQNKKTGKWISNKNVISDRVCPDYWISHVNQNFIWMQFKTVTHQNSTYYIFLYEQNTGAYKYPNIKKDWQTYKATRFIILSQSKYNQIQEMLSGKTSDTTIAISSDRNGFMVSKYASLGGENAYNEKNLLAKITNTLDSKGTYDNSLLLKTEKIDGESIIRFRLPYGYYNENDLFKVKEQYFEVKAEAFKKILTLK